MSREATPRSLGRCVAATSRRWDIVLLAALAYLPALASSPGRMPADTKLFLYTDPGGLLGRAASTFEPDQFAGWVPHQQITYLWPSGPWFWLFDALSVPDWVAHRLWIGTIMFTAGLGVRQCARLLGHVGAAALAAAVVYQLSPSLLPYISRTSLLLLPWAALGWIVAATIRATRVDDGTASWTARWREPAAIALIVATVGSANATALAMIVPAPAIWLLCVALSRSVPVQQVAATIGRVAVACVAVSLWWMAMLIVQSRSGAPVLLYSETLEDVSRNSTGSEVLRGLGYWLFYGRDAYAATTTSSLRYLTSSSGIVVSFVVVLIGLAGIGFGRSEHRRFAGLLAVGGMILAVGVHPFGDSSPLVRLLTGDDDTGLALALRSSTRALPVMTLGLALGVAALVDRMPRQALLGSLPTVATWRRAAAGLVVATAIVNMPTLWKARLVDPAIDRAADLPEAWEVAADRLDSDSSGTRVLQLPGQEFGAFDWGYTVDPPLVSATERAVVTRDLLPLGSAPAMDLLYAFDDRVQLGILEPGSIAPVARLLAVGTIWLAGDTDALRFRTPAAESIQSVLDGAPGVEAAETFGSPSTAAPATDLFGRVLVDADAITEPSVPAAQVSLYDVDDADSVTRVKTDEVVVSGSGDGLIDAAAAGLIDGTELIRYGAAVDEVTSDDRVIVTDSFRDRAHHWRSSQDVTGLTETGGPDAGVLDATAADQRLDPLGVGDDTESLSDTQTIAVQRGPVTAIASGYGEPFAYRPENRAVMAIDGDPRTAWSVGDHADPVGAILRLETDRPVGDLTIQQVAPSPGGRQIATIDVVAGGSTQRVDMTAASTDGTGQLVALDAPVAGTIDIVITGVTTGDPAVAASRAGVGFAEVDTGLGVTTEFIRPPIETLRRLTADQVSLDVVLTRERVDATSFWRDDPEPVLRRLLPLTAAGRFETDVTVRLDQRLSDVELAALLGNAGATADRRLPGVAHRGSAAVDGDPSTSWLTPVDDAVGATLTVPAPNEAVTLIDLVQPIGDWSTISRLVVTGQDSAAEVVVPPPDAEGRSQVTVPAGVITPTAPFTLTIADIVPTIRTERRYGDLITMPAGISEITGTPGIGSISVDSDRPVSRSCDAPLLTVDGTPVSVEFDTTVGALLDGEAIVGVACDGPLDLDAREHEIVGVADTGFTVDRVVLSTETSSERTIPTASVAVRDQTTRHRTVEVDCPEGCWLVFGMGHNMAWAATGPTGDLGEPLVVDGGFNGWWIGPTDGLTTVTIRWTAQRLVTIGLAISFAAVLACIALLTVDRRRRPAAFAAPATPSSSSRSATDSGRVAIVTTAAVALGVALLVAPVWGVIAAAVGLADVACRRWIRPLPILASSGLGAAAFVAIAVTIIERRDAPFPNAGWTAAFDHLNGVAITGVALVAASTMLRPRPDRP